MFPDPSYFSLLPLLTIYVQVTIISFLEMDISKRLLTSLAVSTLVSWSLLSIQNPERTLM